MGLLDKIEKKVQKHPLVEEDYESKIYYLNAIAYFISVDDVISDAEKTAFNSIIELLNCDNVKDDLYDFIENSDVEEFENIFQYIKDKDYFLQYILDVFYLLEDGELNKNEKRFLNIILDLLDYKEDDILPLLSFCKAIKDENSKGIRDTFTEIYRNDFLLKNINTVKQFYKLTNSSKRELSQMILNNEIPSLEKELQRMLKKMERLPRNSWGNSNTTIAGNVLALSLGLDITDNASNIKKDEIKNKIKAFNNQDKVIDFLLEHGNFNF